MRLNRPMALIVLALTFAPWVFLVVLFSTLSPTVATLPAPGEASEQFFQQFQQQFESLFRFQLVSMLIMLAVLVFYIVHLFNTNRVPADKKALWAVVLVLGNLFAMPVYWYWYVWPRSSDGAT
jgi:hypothetical protein